MSEIFVCLDPNEATGGRRIGAGCISRPENQREGSETVRREF